ncbi:hypothetical protein ACHAPJ_011691 [Fusarium lateritium]
MSHVESEANRAAGRPSSTKDDVERRTSIAEDAGKDVQARYDKIDKEVAKYAGSEAVFISPEESTRLRRMIDKRVLVVMITTYFLQAIDKGTLSFASIMNMPADVGMALPDGKPDKNWPWLTTCVYIGILFVEYPQNYIIARVPVAKYLSFSIIAWSLVLGCHAATSNIKGLITVRTLLGIFESACQPAFVVLSGMWYRREEQASRVTYCEEDKRLMVERVRDNQTGIQNKTFKKEQIYEAIKDPQTWCYAAIQFCTTFPTSGLGAFANIVIKEAFHFSTLQTQLLAMVLGFYIIIVLLGSVYLVKKWNQNIYTMLGFVVPSFIGTILIMTIKNTNFSTSVGLLICYYITLSFWSAQTLGLSMMSRNVAGQTKKTFVIANNFIWWSAGNAAGSQVFLAKEAPTYHTAFSSHLGCYALLVIVLVFFRWHLSRENKKRDELAAAGVREAADDRMVHAFEDLTDRENPNFRYVL